MRIRYDQQADALYLRLDEAEIVESQEVQPGIVLDFNAANEVIGIEVLRVRERLPKSDPSDLRVEVA
jgi:uncharacterized protein YuzE